MNDSYKLSLNKGFFLVEETQEHGPAHVLLTCVGQGPGVLGELGIDFDDRALLGNGRPFSRPRLPSLPATRRCPRAGRFRRRPTCARADLRSKAPGCAIRLAGAWEAAREPRDPGDASGRRTSAALTARFRPR